MPTEKRKAFFPLPAILILAGIFLLFPRPDLRADENETIAGVSLLEGEVYYWPVLSGETRTPENRLVILERDLQKISLLSAIEFQPQAKEIIPGSFPVLDKLNEVLNVNPDLIVLIRVQTEKTGKAEAGLGLARERAGQVRDYLLSKGTDASRMAAQGVPPAGKTLRRPEPPVEIIITEQDKDLVTRWMNLKKNTDFYANDEIKTGKGKVKILFPNGAVLSLLPQTYIKIIGTNRVKLIRGSLLSNLEKFKADQEFEIETLNAGTGASGAVYVLSFFNGSTTLTAIKGEVSAHSQAEPDKNVVLVRGKRLNIKTGKELGRPEPMKAEKTNNILNEFKFNNFDQSQSLYDQEMKKRWEKIEPPVPAKSPEPFLPPESQAIFPSAETQATFPSAGTQAATP